jgi:hypothetical protein
MMLVFENTTSVAIRECIRLIISIRNARSTVLPLIRESSDGSLPEDHRLNHRLVKGVHNSLTNLNNGI